MGFAVYFAVPVIASLLFRHVLRQPAGTLFLEGLHAYLPNAAAIPAPPPGAKSNKKDRKLLQKRQLALKGAQSSLVAQQLSPSALAHFYAEPSTFGGSFETLGVLLLVVIVGLAVHFTLGPLLGLWQDVFLWSLCPLVVAWAAGQLLLLECNGSLARLAGDRVHVAALGVAAAAVAYAVLAIAPVEWFGWDMNMAAEQLDELFNGGVVRLMAARMRNFRPPPPLHSDPLQVGAGLAIAAGILAAALLGPSMRMAKLYGYISPVPQWAGRYLAPHPVALTAMRLALALPLAVVLGGIRPVADYVAGALASLPLPVALLSTAVGPALLATIAIAQLLSVRPLTAAHLGGGLLEWHLLRHSEGVASPGTAGAGATAASSSLKDAREGLMKKRLVSVYATVCHVSLQLLAPAAIMLSLALMYGSASGALDSLLPATPLLYDMNAHRSAAPLLPPPVSVQPPASQETAAAEGGLEGLDVAAAVSAAASAVASGALPPLPSLDFLRCAVSFLAWWCCTVTCLFTYPMLFIYRMGLHVG